MQNGNDMLLAFSYGPASNTQMISKEYTWEQLAKRLSKPHVGAKDGAYLLRGGRMKEQKRAEENLLEAELLVIDGDSRIDPETGEELKGAPPIDVARAALDACGYKYIIHTSHSYNPTTQYWRYRIFIPAKMRSKAELDASVKMVIDQLHAAGCFIDDVPENSDWARAWFLPRCDAAYLDAYKCYASLTGRDVDVAEAVQLASRKISADRTVSNAKEKPEGSKPDNYQDSIIKKFNKSADLDWVRCFLEARGYKFAGKHGEDYRYMAPQSETKTAGVSVFKGQEGDWCVYSWHGAHDPLSHVFCDPFRLYALFEHNCDLKAAAQALKAPDPEFDAALANPENFSVASSDAPGKQKDRFEWITRQNGTAPVLNGNWLIKKVLPAEGLGVIFGRPGSGKTFTVMDIAMHIASGVVWRGMKTRRAGVSYVSPEAGRLGVNRVIGWCKYHDAPWPDAFRLSPAGINLCSSADDAAALVNDIRANQPNCRLVVIDTLNRAMAGGDENSGEDMGKFVSLCDRIAKELRAFVLVVHHSGKDAAKGSRGHSSLLGAVSLEIEVTKEQAEPGIIKITKMRDGEDGGEFGFDIDSVPLGTDEDGEDVTTGISLEADASVARAARSAEPKGRNQITIARAFDQFVMDHGRPNPPGCGFAEPGHVTVADADAFVEFALGKVVGGKPHEKRKTVREVVTGLQSKGYFVVNAGMIWRKS